MIQTTIAAPAAPPTDDNVMSNTITSPTISRSKMSLTPALNGQQDGPQTLTVSEIYSSVLRDYPDVLDVNQVSEILGTSTKTVYRLLNQGAISSLKVGRAFKIPKLYVLQYLKVLDRCNKEG